jgi:osmotically-inducible protein OsmY
MKYRLIIGFLITSLLTSCLAVVVAGAAAGFVVYDRRTVSVLESDARIFHVVHKNIVKNPHFRDSRIVVVSFNKVVLLLGQARAPSLRNIAEKIAQGTPDVRRVYDEITVRPPLSLNTITKDTLITGQVRSFMLNKKGLESGSIRIVTEDGIVYLMGIATHEQANLAVHVARQIQGVRKVVKVFQYIT